MTLERLEITPFANLIGDVLTNRRTGTLTILRGPFRRTLHWVLGELVLIAPSAPEESLASFLVQRRAVPMERVAHFAADDPKDAVLRFNESGFRDPGTRQTLLREWMTALFLPLFSLDEGTAALNEEAALLPDRRIFIPSTPALVLDGIRGITNGLVLRRSLGDLKREIEFSGERRALDALPLTEPERVIALSLREPQSIELFLKQHANDSLPAARVTLGMLTLGVFTTMEVQARPPISADDVQRDLELLAAIGPNDPRALQAVAYSRQITQMDHYQLLGLPRAATKTQITAAAETLKRKYDPATFPPAARETVQSIVRRIDEALLDLQNPSRRTTYDSIVQRQGAAAGEGMQQHVARRNIAEQNHARAKELAASGDYYGAIVLLKQALQFVPDNADAWFLLGSCQERNPKWRREAVESLQHALSVDPSHTDTMIALGDIYRSEGLTARAQNQYEDVLRIDDANQQAKSRLEALKRR